MSDSPNKLNEALAFHENGQLAQAKTICACILATEPSHADALHLLGVIEYQMNNPQQAIELISQAIDIEPNRAVFYSNRGMVLQALERFNEAIKDYDSGIAIDPNLAGLYFNRGNALQSLKQIEAAIENYGQAIALDPNFAHAFSNLGNALQELKRFREALNNYDQAIDLKPDYASVYFNRGLVLKELNELEKAIDSYNCAITIEADFADAYFNRGNAFYALKELELALADYEKAIAIKPELVDAHLNYGLVLQKLMRFEAAVESYDRAIAINSNFTDAYVNRGNALQKLMRFEAAVASYDRAIAINPNNATTHFNLGSALAKLKQYEAALASHSRAIALKPDYADAYNNHGNVLQKLKQYGAAIKDYCKSIDIDKANKKYWRNFSTCLTKIDSFKRLDHIDDYILNLLDHIDVFQPLIVLPSILRYIDHNETIIRFLGAKNYINDTLAISATIKELCAIPLFIAILRLITIRDYRYENSLTLIRRFILKNYANFEDDHNLLKFQYALARQCFINEYVYLQTDEETDLITELEKNIEDSLCKNEKVDVMKIAILGSYKALHGYPWANRLIELDNSEDYRFSMAIQVVEYYEEQKIRSSIQILSPIENPVSQEVRAQYEQNPYPRWLATQTIHNPIAIRDLFNDSKLNTEFSELAFSDSPEILIAGCGTGQHALSTASRFKNSRVTAIDLSLGSLSYAIRKTQQLQITNIEYLQADILELKKLNKEFDIVESCGVLHHMSNPLDGWKILADCTKPNGLMKIGLYSGLARMNITQARTLIKRKKLSSTTQDIRNFRNQIINSHDSEFLLSKQLLKIADFYTTSECRDLLFHVQEHCFNLIEIDEIIKSLGLTFIGFEFFDAGIRDNFKLQMPHSSEYSLMDWHKFELANPNTFISMYQFWLKK